MSHENTVTVEIDGGYYNVPTIVNGRQVSEEAAADLAKRLKRLGTRFGTMEEAVDAAARRSRSFDRERPGLEEMRGIGGIRG